MRYFMLMLAVFGLFYGGVGGCGASNFCDNTSAERIQLRVTNNQCSFNLNNGFTACLGPSGATLVGLVTSGQNVNCSLEADTLNHVAENIDCAFTIHSISENLDYICYAGITNDGNLSGSIYCDPGTQDNVVDGCSIGYQ